MDANSLSSTFAFFCSPQMKETFSTYHKSLQTLAELYHPSRNWQLTLHGTGFDGIYPHLQYDLEQSPSGYIFMSQKTPHNIALFKHRQVLVLQDNEEEYKAQFPLLFYLKASSLHPGNVKLWLSSRTHSLLQQNDYGLMLDKAINVSEDESGLPRFFLSSDSTKNDFLNAIPSYIMMHSNDLVKIPASLNRLLNEDPDELHSPVITFNENTYGVERMIGFHCPQWPENARTWPYRKRKWPAKELIQTVTEKGILVVPCQYKNFDVTNKSKWNNEWSLSFIEAEKELLSNLNDVQQFCFILFREMLMSQMQSSLIEERELKYVMLWALEENDTTIWSSENMIKCLQILIKALGKCLRSKTLNHYFIPEINLWSEMKDDEMTMKMAEDMDYLCTNTGELIEICESYSGKPILDLWQIQSTSVPANQRQDIQNCIVQRLQKSLIALFDQHIILGFIKLYASLVSKSSIESCITIAKDSAQIVSKLDYGNEYIIPVKEMITNILGNLYLAKAVTLKPSTEKRFFVNKAEECLLLSHNMDMIAGKVRLANMFYMTARFTDCIQLLEEVLQHSGHTPNRYVIDEASMTPTQIFNAQLWIKYMNKNYVFGVLFSRQEKEVVPSAVKTNFAMAYNQMLGVLVNPVAYFDAEVYARLLMTMSLIKLKRKHEALECLNVLENMCEKEHDDLNEKRNVAYLNVAAHCYLLLDEKERAVHSLSQSLVIMSNPRNPARWTLTGIQTEKARAMIKHGIGAAAAIGAVAILVTAVRSKFA